MRVLVPRTIEEALRALSDQIRELKRDRARFGSWTIYQDVTTGNLMASYYNGAGEDPTVVTLAVK